MKLTHKKGVPVVPKQCKRDKKRVNKFKKRKFTKKKEKFRNVQITFKKKKKGGKKKIDNKVRKIKKMKRKQVIRSLKKANIKVNRNSPTSTLRDILMYKETTGVNIIQDF